jgi:type II secretory pathway component PulF
MRRLSEIYEQDSHRMLARSFSLIEPLLISILCAVIGIILLALAAAGIWYLKSRSKNKGQTQTA